MQKKMLLATQVDQIDGQNRRIGFGVVDEAAVHYARTLQDARVGASVFESFASQHSPPVADYPIVQKGLELLEVLASLPESSASRRYARVSEETRYVQVEGEFSVPANTVATIDCQGSVLSFEASAESMPAATGSALDMYSCTVLGFPENSTWAANVTLWDVALIYPCQVCDEFNSLVSETVDISLRRMGYFSAVAHLLERTSELQLHS
jgi:hypothetical protein